MTEYCLRIDHREPTIIKNAFPNAIRYNLPAGDFEFLENNKTVLLIERKEIGDLCSSLTDGRFDAQKSKLSSACSLQHHHHQQIPATMDTTPEPFPIAYLLEGVYDESHAKKSAIDTIILTTQFRDGFFVLRTNNILETIECVKKLLELFQRGKMNPISQSELHRRFIMSRSTNLNTTNTKNWWEISLSQMDGVGPSAAKAISQKYPTVQDLLEAYSVVDEKETMLQDLKNGSRRLGPKLSKTVWKSLCATTSKSAETEISTTTTTKTIKRKKCPTTTKQKGGEEFQECLFDSDSCE